jgi:hypothetical protein
VTWLITVFGILAVLGSVLWLKPSPAQQRQVRLRALARQLGIDVRLAQLPQTRRERVRQQATDAGVVYRLLRFDLDVRLPRDYVLVRENADSQWEAQTEELLPGRLQQALDDVLPTLPRDIVAIEITAHGPGVYWRERGDEQTVRQLGLSMERLAQALLAA